ncbi:MAG: hypothetical protein EXS40_02980 [Opitutaceae bacterium]|nr:hypothetical protein [Opitutaceae bacterium]
MSGAGPILSSLRGQTFRYAFAAATVLASLALAAPPFGKGPRDHSLCCGLKIPISADGGPLDFSDPAYAKAVALHNQSFDSESSALPGSADPDHPGARMPLPPPPPARPILRLPGPLLAALDGPLETQSGYTKIAFSQLAGFTFTAPAQPLPPGTPPPDVLAQVPASIRRLDGKKVVLTGFMLPTKLEGGFATEFFFLSSSQLCCYGVTPIVNEWIAVKMKKEGLPPVQDVPMFLAGRLRVRAQWDDGMLSTIYELEGDGLLKMKN